jgi:nucleoside-diphosphate kinase
MESTLVLLKPDCVQRRLIGRIISRFEEKGLNVVAMKMMQVTPELSKQHYAEHVSKPFYPNLESFITAAPIVEPQRRVFHLRGNVDGNPTSLPVELIVE